LWRELIERDVSRVVPPPLELRDDVPLVGVVAPDRQLFLDELVDQLGERAATIGRRRNVGAVP
jgi:hypothetical protein